MNEDRAKKMSKQEYELVDINKLKPHPKNYREHPDDQIDHIGESIKKNGVYRNIVIAKDNVILAGHGVVKACKKIGLTEIPVKKLNINSDSIRALRILAGDNEMGHLAEVNDRALSEILKQCKDDVDGLLGTGYDEKMLANLVFVTRAAHEIKDINEAAEWAGMPEFSADMSGFRLIVSFENEIDRKEFADKLGITLTPQTKAIWYPQKERDDSASVKFEN